MAQETRLGSRIEAAVVYLSNIIDVVMFTVHDSAKQIYPPEPDSASESPGFSLTTRHVEIASEYRPIRALVTQSFGIETVNWRIDTESQFLLPCARQTRTVTRQPEQVLG